MKTFPITEVIPQSNIIVMSPHFDDFLFMIGGYATELKRAGLLHSKKFHINILFSRSNYLANTGPGNEDKSLDRIKLATGKRVLEDQECLDEILGEFNYVYSLSGEKECFTRGKAFADSEMEFPHGMYEDFDALDNEIFQRMKDRVRQLSGCEDTALIFPLAFKEHIDHFIVREAAMEVAKEKGADAKAVFYFQEDKPYGGIATEIELKRTERFIKENKLASTFYRYNPDDVVRLAFKHYISQVEEVYKTGILARGQYLKELLNAEGPCDRICSYHPMLS